MATSAWRRLFPPGPCPRSRMRASAVRPLSRILATAAAVLCLPAGTIAQQRGAPAPRPPVAVQPPSAQQPPAPQPATSPSGDQLPTFRTGANLVRVDVFPTKGGQPVQDLTAADFEVYEDNKP